MKAGYTKDDCIGALADAGCIIRAKKNLILVPYSVTLGIRLLGMLDYLESQLWETVYERKVGEEQFKKLVTDYVVSMYFVDT